MLSIETFAHMLWNCDVVKWHCLSINNALFVNKKGMPSNSNQNTMKVYVAQHSIDNTYF